MKTKLKQHLYHKVSKKNSLILSIEPDIPSEILTWDFC